MSSKRDQAARLLVHYMMLASKGERLDDLDHITEIQMIVDLIIDAAMEELANETNS